MKESNILRIGNHVKVGDPKSVYYEWEGTILKFDNWGRAQINFGDERAYCYCDKLVIVEKK